MPTHSGRTTAPKDQPPLVTMADILAAKQPPTVTVPICVDPTLVESRDTARKAAEEARRAAALAPKDNDRADTAKAAQDALDAAEEAVAAQTVTFTFRAISRADLAVLLRLHPPTDAQVEEHRAELRRQGRPFANERPQFDVDRFPPALISAACISPEITIDEARTMWDAWTDGETQALFLAAWQINAVIAS